MSLIPGRSGSCASRSRRILLLCSRQLGKSTATACLALAEACYRPESLVLLVSRSERQSTLLFEKVSRFYKQLRPVEAEKELALLIRLVNGSEIYALPGDGDTIRGFGPRLVVLDEASRIPDDVMTAVLPMLVSNAGRLVALSTPRGKIGFFYDKWMHADSTWERINAKASDPPDPRRGAGRTTCGPWTALYAASSTTSSSRKPIRFSARTRSIASSRVTTRKRRSLLSTWKGCESWITGSALTWVPT